jgi:glycosyltransferase involved in cell wall biosynthesis
LKIVINTRLLIKDKLDGIGWFTYETVKRLTELYPEYSFIFLFDRPFSEDFVFSKNVTPVVLKPRARHPILWYMWFEYSVRLFLKKSKPDLFISPDGYLCLGTKVKSLAVIHDINFFRRPKDLPFMTRMYYNYFFPKFAKKSFRLVTVSEFSKCDIVDAYGIDPKRIDVVYNGSNSIYRPLDESAQLKTRKLFSDSKSYFLFIGSMHPRKNIPGLIKAFELYKEKSNSDFKLLIVGSKFFLTKEIDDLYAKSNYKEDIIFTGRLNPETLHQVLASAFALTFVPLYEGFGIPVLEAFNCDVPVICSNITSLPEVVGDAALLVSPENVVEIAQAMVFLSENSLIRESLIEKARIQRQQFGWEKTTKLFSDSIEKCLLDESEKE